MPTAPRPGLGRLPVGSPDNPATEERSLTDGSDLEWLGLERSGPRHWTFELLPALSRLDGKFYGGTGIAVATAVMEAETGRRALWSSVQFVSSAITGDHFDCRVEVLAEGRRTSQLRVSGWHDDRLVFAGLGATGEARPGPVEASFGHMPELPAPQDCPPWAPLAAFGGGGGRPGWLAITDAREADRTGSMWMRIEGRPLTPAAMAFLADVVPNGTLRAAGRVGAGTSLDNTLRFGRPPDGDWMLVEMDPHMVSGGYVHGAARLWTEDGELVGIASQTAGVMLFDKDPDGPQA